VIWAKELQKAYGAKVPRWGFAGSPLIEGNLLILEGGGAGAGLVALDKATGAEFWKSGNDAAGYSSAIVTGAGDQRTVIMLHAQSVVGRRVRDGQELWRHPWKTDYDGNAATPITPAAAIKLYEVTKYYTSIGFGFNLLPIYINQKKFDSLTASQKKALLDAAAQVKPLAGQWARDKVKSSAAEFEKAGVHIYKPNKDEMAKWLSVREKVWKEIVESYKGKIDLAVANDIFKLSPR